MFKREKDTTSRGGSENTIEKLSVLWTCEEVIQIIQADKNLNFQLNGCFDYLNRIKFQFFNFLILLKVLFHLLTLCNLYKYFKTYKFQIFTSIFKT